MHKEGIPLVKETIEKSLGTEDLFIEAMRDMVKDEIKKQVRTKLDENPELRQELKDAIGMLMEAKAREMFATVKLAKSSAKLGLTIMPDHLKNQMSKEILSLFEKEISILMEKGL